MSRPLTSGDVAGVQTTRLTPHFAGSSLDVVLTAKAALVWDRTTGDILYEKNAGVRRPVASLAKLASILVIRGQLPALHLVVIPSEAAQAQKFGAHVKLPVGHHVKVSELIAASLIPSANDAMVSLAVAMSGTEKAFVEEVNRLLPGLGVYNTKLSNSTGLSGGEQYSTAADVRLLLSQMIEDDSLKEYLSAKSGVLVTQEGAKRAYTSTNKLLGTYVTVLAAKTGYTREAGQNFALITRTSAGHEIGAVVLGSDERFQDMKILVEWVERNYTWR